MRTVLFVCALFFCFALGDDDVEVENATQMEPLVFSVAAESSKELHDLRLFLCCVVCQTKNCVVVSKK